LKDEIENDFGFKVSIEFMDKKGSEVTASETMQNSKITSNEVTQQL
jgi:hypothetical protein